MMDQNQIPQKQRKPLDLEPGWQRTGGRIWILVIAVLILFGWNALINRRNEVRINYTAFLKQVEMSNVERIEIRGQLINGTFRKPVPFSEEMGTKYGISENPSNSGGRNAPAAPDKRLQPNADPGQSNKNKPEYKHFTTYMPSFDDRDLMQNLRRHNVVVQAEPESSGSFWVALISLLPFIFFGWLIYAQYRRFQGQGGDGIFSIGKSHAKIYRKTQEAITFKDVAGAEGAKRELAEVVSYLKNPERIREFGAEVPKGIMLVGPPGTGKTLLARAVAGEADVPFYQITGSDFMEMFVGVGAKRVRSLFEDAKKSAPSIIFIDEIDAVGRHRGAGIGGGHDEREQTLNQLLSELDGFEPNVDVIVMTATNRPDVLDPALMRPGRFDRRIVIDLPTTRDRRKILDIYSRNKHMAGDVDLDAVARSTPGFSGADLKNMLNEAALMVARKGTSTIHHRDIEEARDKVLMGIEREGMTWTEDEKRMVACHEAGHAIVGAKLPNADPIYKVSIVPRNMSMGATQQFPDHEKYIYQKQYLTDRLAVMMGGRAAEMLIYKAATSGAGNDLQQATRTARKMVLEWGMSGRFEHMALGSRDENIFLGEDLAKRREYSEATAREVDREVEKLLNEAFHKAMNILKEDREVMDRLADELIEQEEIPGARVYELLGSERKDSKGNPEAGMLRSLKTQADDRESEE